jgi:hypothetical protein
MMGVGFWEWVVGNQRGSLLVVTLYVLPRLVASHHSKIELISAFVACETTCVILGMQG